MKKNKLNMLRDERKCSLIKCSFKTREGRKKGREKETKKYEKQEIAKSVADINSIILLITLDVNDLNIPIKKLRLSGGSEKKKKRPNIHWLYETI